MVNEREMADRIKELLQKSFKPEFLNRITEIIVFHPLNESEIATIIDIQLAKVKERLGKQDINVTFTPKLVKLLARKGFDPLYGARPLKRAIQTFILNPLSMKLIDGSLHEGETITIDAAKTTRWRSSRET